MKRARLNGEQIIAVLKEAEAGAKASELCRRGNALRRRIQTRQFFRSPSGREGRPEKLG